MKTIAALLRERKLKPAIEEQAKAYHLSCADIEASQIDKFNSLWADIWRGVPFYHALVADGMVPAEIRSWEDFTRLPILTRSSLQADVTRYINPSRTIAGWSTTGGSTGTPFRTPFTSLESGFLMTNAWLGRGFYDIQISDRMFHLWGHSHLFGRGWRRHSKQAQKRIRNWLLGHKVFSAYHLTPQRLREAGNAIIKMRPDFIMGYSRSLLLLAKENADQTRAFRQLPLKAIIATTEAFSQPDDAAFIEDVFGCPVGMEYGAAETGVIAYTHPSDRQYRTFWNTYLVEAIPSSQTTARVLLTSLYPRAMPLIRYEIGDSVENFSGDGHSVLKFDSVRGRDNDLIDVGGGAFVHPVAIIHCIQSAQGVLGVQVVQERDNSIAIQVMCNTPLLQDAEMAIRRNLSTLDPQLANCQISYVDHLEQTPAGKTKWIIKR